MSYVDFSRLPLPEGEEAAHREQAEIFASPMKEDPRMQMDPKSMPFDGMRMFWRGFKPLIELRA